jgi:zinc protease
MPQTLLLAFLTLIGVSLPLSGSQAAVFNPETFELENGMQVVVIPNHRAPVVTHMVWYKVGAADEPPGKSGIAHFLEHLMFKGTEAVPPGEFSKIVARNGGRDNAFTSQDYTAYFQSIARDRLEQVMEMEADRMTGLRLTDAEVLPERDVILEERRSRTDNDPSALLSEGMQAALFTNHPYGTPIIGWAHEMHSLTTEDALEFYKQHYAPNNAILIVSGDITAKELRPLAEKYYGAISPRDVPPRVRPQEPLPILKRNVEYKNERVRQATWSRSYLAPSYNTGEDREAYALQVLSELLGGNSSSRLYRSLVVENPLASSVGTYYDPDSLDSGQFTVYGVPRQGVSVNEVEAAVTAALRQIVNDGVEAEEVDLSKRRLKAAAVYARDSLFNPGRVLGMALTTGQSVDDVESWPARIDSVTPQDVASAARKVLGNGAYVTGILLPPSPAADEGGKDGKAAAPVESGS